MFKVIGVVLLIVVGGLLYWVYSPAFIDKSVDDELSPEITAALEERRQEVATQPTVSDEESETAAATEEPVTETPVVEAEAPATSEVVETPLATPSEPEVAVSTPVEPANTSPIISGPFAIVDTPGHPASGDIKVIEADDERLIRFENYQGTNGPDLKVYLTNDLNATDFVSLGRAKGNQGNINYEIPDGVDVDDYKYVITWCEAFGVLFDYAEIN